jgi:hypothetical protein
MADEKKKDEEKKPSESEILFPDISVAGLKIRPWTFGQFMDMLPVFRKAADRLLEIGIGKNDIDEALSDPSKMLEFVSIILPISGEVIAKTVGVSEEEVRDWPIDKAVQVLIVILSENAGRIKNSFGLGISVLKTLSKAAG